MNTQCIINNCIICCIISWIFIRTVLMYYNSYLFVVIAFVVGWMRADTVVAELIPESDLFTQMPKCSEDVKLCSDGPMWVVQQGVWMKCSSPGFQSVSVRGEGTHVSSVSPGASVQLPQGVFSPHFKEQPSWAAGVLLINLRCRCLVVIRRAAFPGRRWSSPWYSNTFKSMMIYNKINTILLNYNGLYFS